MRLKTTEFHWVFDVNNHHEWRIQWWRIPFWQWVPSEQTRAALSCRVPPFPPLADGSTSGTFVSTSVSQDPIHKSFLWQLTRSLADFIHPLFWRIRQIFFDSAMMIILLRPPESRTHPVAPQFPNNCQHINNVDPFSWGGGTQVYLFSINGVDLIVLKSSSFHTHTPKWWRAIWSVFVLQKENALSQNIALLFSLSNVSFSERNIKSFGHCFWKEVLNSNIPGNCASCAFCLSLPACMRYTSVEQTERLDLRVKSQKLNVVFWLCLQTRRSNVTPFFFNQRSARVKMWRSLDFARCE